MTTINALSLDWFVPMNYDSSRRNVKGTRLMGAFYPARSCRFCIYEVRTMLADASLSTTYHVTDAETVSDADVRLGRRPSVVFRSDDIDDCLRYCETAR